MIFDTSGLDFMGLFGGDPFGAMRQTPWRTPGINPNAPSPGYPAANPSGGVNPLAAQRPDIFARLNAGMARSGIDPGQLGLALLANSGYSPQKRSFGEILGQSALGAQQMGQQKQQDELERRLREAQIRQLDEAPKGPAQPSSVQEYEYAKQNGFKGSFQDWTTIGGQTSRPSSVQEWEFFNSLSKGDQARYLEMKRNPNAFVKDVANVPTFIQGMPGAQVQTTPLTTLPDVVKSEADVAGGKAGGAIVGTREANAPTAYAAFQESSKALEKAMSGTATGPVSGRLPAVTAGQQIAEGAEATMAPILKQLFRNAGEGTFTDQDQALLMQMVPTRKDHPEARKAKIQMIDSIVRAKLAIGNGDASATPPKRIKVDAQGNVIGN